MTFASRPRLLIDAVQSIASDTPAFGANDSQYIELADQVSEDVTRFTKHQMHKTSCSKHHVMHETSQSHFQ
jgi:hypothetical protein